MSPTRTSTSASSGAACSSAAARYEAARLRHRLLLGAHRARAPSPPGGGDHPGDDGDDNIGGDNNDDPALAAGRMMASRAGMASVLHRAIAEANASGKSNAKRTTCSNSGSTNTDTGEQQQPHADVRHLAALLGATLPSAAGAAAALLPPGEVAALAGWAARSNRDHPIPNTTSGNATGGAPAPAPGAATADDFFADYPGCVRTDYSEEDCSSSSSSSCSSNNGGRSEEDDNNEVMGADNDDVVVVVPVKITNGSSGSSSSNGGTGTCGEERKRRPVHVPQRRSQYQQQQQHPNQSASQPQLNPYLYGGSSQGSNGNAIVAGPCASSAAAVAPAAPPPGPGPGPGAAVVAAKGWNDYEPPAGAPSGYRHHGGGGGGAGVGAGVGGTAVRAGGGGNCNGGEGGKASNSNPFQTAREFAGTGGGGGTNGGDRHRNGNGPASDCNGDGGVTNYSGHGNNNSNGRNHSYGTNPYGRGGSSSSSNPYGNPYQTHAQAATATGNSNSNSNSVPSAGQHPGPSALTRPEISAGLKRKFQPPKRIGGAAAGGGSGGVGKDTKMVGRKVYGGGNNSNSGGGGAVARPSSSGGRGGNGSNSSGNQEDDEELPEELQGLDKELVNKIMNEIVDSGESITFDDIAGLADAKQTVLELVCWPMKRPDLFTGLRRGPNGLLLFGPPGTGKTLIGKAIAHESGACFFSISSSSLTSKWIGEGEKLVRTLFAVAAYREPAVVFIDEIDSLLTARKADENEASRRIKTEFLVQLDGTGTSGQGRLLCIGATNRPHELDDAARRRFVKRLYIPLPEQPDREILLRTLLKKNVHSLSDEEITKLSSATHGYSGADLKALCNDASMGPIRDLGARAMEVAAEDVPPISYKHFRRSLKGMNPSVSEEDLDDYIKFNNTYGNKHREDNDDDDDDDSD